MVNTKYSPEADDSVCFPITVIDGMIVVRSLKQLAVEGHMEYLCLVYISQTARKAEDGKVVQTPEASSCHSITCTQTDN